MKKIHRKTDLKEAGREVVWQYASMYSVFWFMYLLLKKRQADRETETEEEQGGGHRVLDEDWSYRVAAAPTLPPYCYLSPSLSSHLRLGPPVAPGTPAPADKEGKRETGRTPEGNRCLRYPGFTYRERRRDERRRREERERVQGKENQCITGFCCFDL